MIFVDFKEIVELASAGHAQPECILVWVKNAVGREVLFQRWQVKRDGKVGPEFLAVPSFEGGV